MSAYRKDFDETKDISFLIKDDKLEKCNEICETVKNSLKKEFHSEPAYNGKYLNAEIKWYNEKVNTNFHDNEIPKEGSQYICLSATLLIALCCLFSTILFLFLEQVKIIILIKFITGNIEISSDSNKENFDEENSVENLKSTNITNNFFDKFFVYMKILKILSKTQRKASKRSSRKISKFVWRGKRKTTSLSSWT